MIINGQDVGKQLITCNGKWDATKRYKRLCIVYKGLASYLSKSTVPAGTPVTDEDYWQKFSDADEAITIELTDYKAQITEQVEALKQAVTTLINDNNADIKKVIDETVAKCNSLEGNINSHLNVVLEKISNVANVIESEQNNLKAAVSAVDKKAENNKADLEGRIASSVLSLQGVMQNEINRLETKVANTPNVATVQPMSLVEPENNKGATRFVVDVDADREIFTTDDIKVGYEVYVIESGLSYVLTEIVLGTNVKTWKLQYHSTIGACYFDKVEEGYDDITVDRAIADEEGTNIRDNYIRKSDIAAYVDELFRTKFVDNMPLILDGSITPSMLSDEVKDLLGAKCITNAADGFTIQKNMKDGTIGLANHDVNANNFRSYGHKHLGYNITDGHNILEQAMIDQDYKFYYVYLDYDLNGATIELPEHIVLQWCGGSFNNGTIKSNGVQIYEKLKGTNLTVE